MPGKRAPGQKQVLTMMDEQFLAEIAIAMEKAGYSDRSKFIRDAVYEKLVGLGRAVPKKMAAAPSREGKGGRKDSIFHPSADTPDAEEVAMQLLSRATAQHAIRTAAAILNEAPEHGPITTPLKVVKVMYKTKRHAAKEKKATKAKL